MIGASGDGAAGGAVAGLFILAVIGFGLYMLPTIIGATRKVVNIGSVFAVNLLLGWTLIGWAVALAMALRTNPPHAYAPAWQAAPSSSPPMPPPPPPPPGMPPPVVAPPALPAGWYADPNGATRWWDGAQWTPHTQPPAAS